MTQAPDLSIIIINWKSADFLRKCLQSIFANASDLSFEVIVVDNASFDGSAELVEREFPGVRFVQSTENLGFAGANNLGVRSAKGRNVLFLNPDTEVIGTALELMSSFLDATPNAGVVGCKLLNSDFSIQTSCIQAFPTILNQALDAEALRKMFPKARLWGMRPLFEDGSEPTVVEVVSGACLMIRRSVFEETGLFNTDYFMFSEDVDLCFRTKQTGWNTYYVGRAVVIHLGGQSSRSKGEKNFADVLMRESRLTYFRQRRGTIYAAAFRITTGFVALARVVLLGGFLVLTVGKVRADSIRRAFAKWSNILRWSLGSEEFAKHRA